MLAPKPLFLSALACFAATAVTGLALPPPEDCIVPEIAFTTLFAPFTLGLLNTGPKTLSLGLPTSHSKFGDQPFIITPGKAEKALFRLTDGKLTTGGPNHDKYQAYFGPVPPDFPPYLSPLLFGTYDDGTRFYGGYGCDPTGAVVQVLSTSEKLVVPSFKPGTGIFGKPPYNENTTFPVRLEVFIQK